MRAEPAKGYFLKLEDLPQAAQVPDVIVIKFYDVSWCQTLCKQIDGWVGNIKSSKTVIVAKRASRPRCRLSFGQVLLIKLSLIGSGNCGNLTQRSVLCDRQGLVESKIPNGICTVQDLAKKYLKNHVAHVPITQVKSKKW